MPTSWRVKLSRGEESQKKTPAAAIIRSVVWNMKRAGIDIAYSIRLTAYSMTSGIDYYGTRDIICVWSVYEKN